jgi:predicted ribosomally synthesized peptide with SipW-like signal peptide
MRNRKQLILSLLALVLVSGLAATSSTFAWFTSTRTASLTFSSATVENRSSDLKVTLAGSLNNFDSESDANNVITLTGANRVTDISGNGINFYKPVWASTEDVASVINEVSTTNVDGYYIDVLLKIERTSTNPNPKGLKVYLGEDTAILPVDGGNAKDVFAVEAARMAVIGYDDAARTNPALKHLYAPVAEASPKYLIENAAETAYELDGYELVDASTELKSTAFVTETLQANATYEIADLMTASEAYVGFRFWIEGTDSETVNDKALGGMFKVALDVYSLEV